MVGRVIVVLNMKIEDRMAKPFGSSTALLLSAWSAATAALGTCLSAHSPGLLSRVPDFYAVEGHLTEVLKGTGWQADSMVGRL